MVEEPPGLVYVSGPFIYLSVLPVLSVLGLVGGS